jgi:hypothetical protein
MILNRLVYTYDPLFLSREATVYPGSQISILGQVSKPSSKRTENVSLATLSNHLKGGVHDPAVFDPFSLNGPQHWGP